MITRIVKLEIDPANADVFRAHFDEVCVEIRNFPGCLGLELLHDLHSNGIFFTWSRWSNEASFETYRQSQLFNATWQKVKPLFVNKAQAWSLAIEKDLGTSESNTIAVS
ncbi:MAG: putative quinol monooxygenase [Bacteroidota bacterium]